MTVEAPRRRGRPRKLPSEHQLDPRCFERLAQLAAAQYYRRWASQVPAHERDEFRQALSIAAWRELEAICRRCPELKIPPDAYVASRLKARLLQEGRFGEIRRRIQFGTAFAERPVEDEAMLVSEVARLRRQVVGLQDLLQKYAGAVERLQDYQARRGREFPLIEVEADDTDGS